MNTYTQEQLIKILDNHKKWLNREEDGTRANLTRANLDGANLDGANLTRANLDGANLDGANLTRANLYGANLDGANLTRANLYGANLDGANLDGANLTRANLTRANLTRANLYGANLDGANLTRANLYGANLYGANLYEVMSDFSLFLRISGMKYIILIKNDLVKIGCQEHTYSKWKSFKEEDITPMANNAMEFYNMIIPVLDFHYKGTEWEINDK